jgi:hypothetical protein
LHGRKVLGDNPVAEELFITCEMRAAGRLRRRSASGTVEAGAAVRRPVSTQPTPMPR